MSVRSMLGTEESLAAIETYSAALADAARASLSARGNLSAVVEHCPGWDLADLLWHVTGVHWFWATIAEQLPHELPEDLTREENRPTRPGTDAELVERFEDGARRLVDVLRAADQSATCWTWAPQQQDVAFITRHQVQEAAVHAWDAVHAGGGHLAIEPHVAADAVEEFLTVSVSSDDDPADPPRPALAGALWICACGGHEGPSPTWLVTDGVQPGTVTWQRVPEDSEPADLAPDGPLVGGHAEPATVLLWLYGRVADPFDGGAGGDTEVLSRFRALTYTD
jgi:uncharacterized protein (TIGR03083 family)